MLLSMVQFFVIWQSFDTYIYQKSLSQNSSVRIDVNRKNLVLFTTPK